MFKNAWRWQDLYREKHDLEARVRLLEPYIVPILALFQGRVIDEPVQTTMLTNYMMGGEVEHEIIMIGGILFFVLEYKPSDDNLA